jgi:pyruvate/2-oxoglutarate dehydrogenase complex dihydrolipoamide dehydrogenase (E3) component
VDHPPRRRRHRGSIVVRLRGGDVVEGSHLLVATGRRPDTHDLGCDAAGVVLDARGFVEVDDQYATSAPGVAEAGELIRVFAALMQAGASARALVDMEAVHPSFAEGVQSVVMALPRYAQS